MTTTITTTTTASSTVSKTITSSEEVISTFTEEISGGNTLITETQTNVDASETEVKTLE